MSFASKSGSMLRCVCRADKQLQHSLRTSTIPSLFSRVSLSTSASVAAPSSSSSLSAPSSSFSTSSSKSAGRVPFMPPENYQHIPSTRGESPLTTKLKEGNSSAASPNAALFRGSSKRADSKRAKELGKEYKESGLELQPDDTIPITHSIKRPIKPSESRTLEVGAGDEFARQYRRLMNGVIGANNIRQELRLQERYEKPKYKRQRLRSARHRRRFANEVGLRVAAVLRAKSQGM